MKKAITCILSILLTACAAQSSTNLSKEQTKVSDDGKSITVTAPNNNPEFQTNDRQNSASTVAAQMISPVIH